MAEIHYDRQFMCDLIEMYKQRQCLWKLKSPDYPNREKKIAAYEDLIKLFKTKDPNATKDTVIKKIDSMRGVFRKELKKVNRAKSEGKHYVPRLWSYNKLLFLIKDITTKSPQSPKEIRFSMGNFNEDEDESNEDIPSPSQDDPFVDVPQTESSKASVKRSSSNIELSGDENMQTWEEHEEVLESGKKEDEFYLIVPSNDPEYGNIDKTIPKKVIPTINVSKSNLVQLTQVTKKPRFQNSTMETIEPLTKSNLDLRYSIPSEDEFDIVGKNIANKLRKLSRDTKIVAEKLVMDILFEAELGNLDRYSKLSLQITKK